MLDRSKEGPMKIVLRATLLGLATLLASCETIHSHSTKLRIEKRGGKYHVTSNSARCAKVTFYDSGGSIGCEVYHLPAEDICPPPGTLGVRGEIVDCPPGHGHRIHSTGDLPGQEREGLGGPSDGTQLLETYHFFGMPHRIEPGEVYLEYDLAIRAPTRVRACAIRDQILAQARLGVSGFQRPIPGLYTIRHLVRAQLVGRDVFLTLFGTERIEELNLDLNDVRGYRGLQDALLLERNGWFLAGLAIGLSDLEWGILPGVEYVNHYRVELTRGGQAESLAGEWGYRIGT